MILTRYRIQPFGSFDLEAAESVKMVIKPKAKRTGSILDIEGFRLA